MNAELKHNFELEQVKSNAWMLSFVDILSILITFFILVYATNIKQLILPTSVKAITPGFAQDKELLDNAYIYQIIEQELARQHLKDDIILRKEDENIIMSVASDNLFKFNSAEFSLTSLPLIKFLNSTLANLDNAIAINGVDSWEYFPSNISLKKYFRLPLLRALTLAKNIVRNGYKFDITTNSLTGPENKLNNAKTHLMQRVDIKIYNYKAKLPSDDPDNP